MKNTLYLECYSGISGDMTVAALLDLGADQTVLENVLKSLPIDGFTVNISRVKKAGLDVCDFNVILAQENHDHDMEYLHQCHPVHHPEHMHPDDHAHGSELLHQHHLEHQPEHMHPDDHAHGSELLHQHHLEHQPEHQLEHMHPDDHTHESEHQHHSAHGTEPAAHHMHRSLSDILSIIRKADMSEHAKQTASKIFTILGEAEAKAHGTTLEQVHFHEVGAVDSIVDIISTAVCLDNLDISDVIIPVLQEGTGTVRCQHGILPIPVPATANIIQQYQIPLQIMDTHGEFVTPTGAAIAAAIRSSGQLPENFRILRTGLGGGKRTYERPGILRAMLIDPCTEPADSDIIYKLETNMDDCTGEMMGYVMECLFSAGARDVHYFPVYMKKNRPAYQLNVLCTETDIPKLEQIIFSQTTTIGIRRQRMERTVLPRETKTIRTIYGEIQVKICESEGHRRMYPEYESIVRLCRQTGIPFPDIYRKLQEICCEQCL